MGIKVCVSILFGLDLHLILNFLKEVLMQNPFDNVIYVCFVWCGGAFLRARVGYFQSSERLA